jgi:DNA-binding HxlR family transcriptional regulator
MKKESRSNCPLGVSLDIFGDRWTLLILRDVLIADKVKYQDFLESKEGISTNLLAQRLDFLVENGFLLRSKDPNNKKQVFYFPTKKALDLLPIMCGIIHWGLKYHPDAQSNRVVETMLRNEKQFIKSIFHKFKSKNKKAKSARSSGSN